MVDGDDMVRTGQCFTRSFNGVTHYYRQDIDKVLHIFTDNPDNMNDVGINTLDKCFLQTVETNLDRIPVLVFKNHLRRAREILK